MYGESLTSNPHAFTLTSIHVCTNRKYTFLVCFLTVIRCEDIPEFDKASHAEVSSPYLPNTGVHYKCVDGYQLKDDLYITCERSGSEAQWINTAITCIPGNTVKVHIR